MFLGGYLIWICLFGVWSCVRLSCCDYFDCYVWDSAFAGWLFWVVADVYVDNYRLLLEIMASPCVWGDDILAMLGLVSFNRLCGFIVLWLWGFVGFVFG